VPRKIRIASIEAETPTAAPWAHSQSIGRTPICVASMVLPARIDARLAQGVVFATFHEPAR